MSTNKPRTSHNFLIYINDLRDNLISSANLFAVDSSLFFTVDDINASRDALNKDFLKKHQNGHING